VVAGVKAEMAASFRQRRPHCCRFRCLKHCTAVESIAFVVITYVIVIMNTDVHESYTKHLSSVHSSNLVEAIAGRANQDRYIVLAMVDEAFSDMALNLYEASFAPHHIDNYLFVGVGNSTCNVLHRQSLACFSYVADPSAREASEFGDTNFLRKMNIRTDMIIEALTANFTVVHTDLDVSFLANPFNEIKVFYFVVLYRSRSLHHRV